MGIAPANVLYARLALDKIPSLLTRGKVEMAGKIFESSSAVFADEWTDMSRALAADGAVLLRTGEFDDAGRTLALTHVTDSLRYLDDVAEGRTPTTPNVTRAPGAIADDAPWDWHDIDDAVLDLELLLQREPYYDAALVRAADGSTGTAQVFGPIVVDSVDEVVRVERELARMAPSHDEAMIVGMVGDQTVSGRLGPPRGMSRADLVDALRGGSVDPVPGPHGVTFTTAVHRGEVFDLLRSNARTAHEGSLTQSVAR